ncbi:hypothetical protein L195_g029030 [Trifolium pratense]|uniref:Uncharacterized protein n=1 Tax=Trifolium pratense TaxID=57577 RepID=A0A2K3L3L4_TRIPR|nr:hypothetical protein L195_g029030 [Trifolium pratense]
MSGKMVFVYLINGEDVEKTVKEAKEFFDKFFESIRRWNVSEVVQERCVWVRIYGIPIHTWNVELFTKAVSSFGTLLCVDPSTSDKSRLDFAKVLLITKSLDVINFMEKIMIYGIIFTLRMVEDFSIWPVEDVKLVEDDGYETAPNCDFDSLEAYEVVDQADPNIAEDLIQQINDDWRKLEENNDCHSTNHLNILNEEEGRSKNISKGEHLSLLALHGEEILNDENIPLLANDMVQNNHELDIHLLANELGQNNYEKVIHLLDSDMIQNNHVLEVPVLANDLNQNNKEESAGFVVFFEDVEEVQQQFSGAGSSLGANSVGCVMLRPNGGLVEEERSAGSKQVSQEESCNSSPNQNGTFGPVQNGPIAELECDKSPVLCVTKTQVLADSIPLKHAPQLEECVLVDKENLSLFNSTANGANHLEFGG